ncbi:hypothetical protein ABBQ38_011927 [Trebouxia sp. C0009 RCD-2024]
MIIRLRSRDGLERIEVDAGGTIGTLRQQISSDLNMPRENVTLSKDQKLLVSKTPEQFKDLSNNKVRLKQAGVQHGDMIYMHYPFARKVESVIKKSVFEGRGFGAKMTVEQLIAKQTRIERQEEPHCASVSFDRHAANVFQTYVSSALAFSIKRGGILYGNKDEEGNVMVHAIYEPPQEGNAETLQMERQTEEEMRADFIAKSLGMQKVGWIFTQSSKERDYIMNTEEICQMAAWQDEVGEHCVTGVVSLAMTDEGSDVHFEAFQVSDQCARMVKAGWFDQQKEPSGVSTLTDPKEPTHKQPVIVAGKDVKEVDNDYFLIPVSIKDHEGPLSTTFPVENRLLPQGPSEFKQYMRQNSSKAYWQRLADFHLLMYLGKQPGLDLVNDIAVLLECINHKATVPEGYTLIIDSLAEN